MCCKQGDSKVILSKNCPEEDAKIDRKCQLWIKVFGKVVRTKLPRKRQKQLQRADIHLKKSELAMIDRLLENVKVVHKESESV